MNYNSSEQTAAWFFQRSVSDELVLNPPFQRKPVWTLRQRSPLIESLLMQLPVPEIYLQQKTSPDGKTQYIVVDGQQRIRSLIDFVKASGQDGFELRYLEADSPWLNRSFSDFDDSDREQLFGYKFAVRFLNNVSDLEVKELFRRLNRHSMKLTAQELRNATYSGPLVRVAESLAEDGFWAENRIISTLAIRRMGDIEFMSELVIALMNGPQSGSSGTIDSFYLMYEDSDELPSQSLVKRLFGRTLDTIQSLYPGEQLKVSRWHNKSDFYSLFVALSQLVSSRTLPSDIAPKIRNTLDEFSIGVDRWLGDRDSQATDKVKEYVLAVEKGANDRARRAARHKALLAVLTPLMTK